jgi:hypothetical protein
VVSFIAGTHWTGGWMDPETGLDATAKIKKNSFVAPAENRTPVVQPVA